MQESISLCVLLAISLWRGGARGDIGTETPVGMVPPKILSYFLFWLPWLPQFSCLAQQQQPNHTGGEGNHAILAFYVVSH